MSATLGQAFTYCATHALAACGFQPPATGEACVALFDSAPWKHFGEQAHALLDQRERERAARFRHARDRDTYVLAHAMWRHVLGLTLRLEAARVPLSTSPSGQPILTDTSYATSLSHSGTQVAIAITDAVTIGVDLERSPPRTALRDLAAMLCSSDEAATLALLPPAQHETWLLQLWTRKEALLKAFGVGLKEAPSNMSVSATSVVAPPASAANMPPCRVHPLQLPIGLVGAWAAPVNVARCSSYVLGLPQS
ncbi:4'-phosphopantetheinyl transferase superfamily protein [Dyella halodurans]|uniref:4'-phosphopantetheinyl transferase family protein n=1 Tax=Dyella halodurans TaxID=1920171 RepID=A0ABV9C1B1_9GAMM|nr:4'-phosphopantetheinyl transferase superfamily protein [Dyella halodurans]